MWPLVGARASSSKLVVAPAGTLYRSAAGDTKTQDDFLFLPGRRALGILHFLSSVSTALSLAVTLTQQPIGGHLAFALHFNFSSQLQLEAVELLEDIPCGGRHVDLQCCAHTDINTVYNRGACT